MRCPQCHSTSYTLGQPCPNCQFDHDILTLEKLSNTNYLLAEMQQWSAVPRRFLSRLENHYTTQKHALEIELGLRHPPPTAAEAAALRNKLLGITALLNHLPHWVEKGWVTAQVADKQRTQYTSRQQEIETRLQQAPRLPQQPELRQKLIRFQYLRQSAISLHDEGQLTAAGYESILNHTDSIITQLEIRLGLRPEPAPEPPDITILTDAPAAAHPPLPPPPPKRPPRDPFSWDKVWDTLLSEKTLKAVLFLAVALLIGGAISIVVNEWDNFTRFAQALFLGGFTAVFYILGWYVYHKMKLEGSGLALTAVASLLIPLDFYTYYISGGFPPDSWPTVWLITSLVCLAIYTLTVYAMHSEMLAYLIPLAAGSTTLALSNWLNLPTEWWILSFTAVPFLCAILSTIIPHPSKSLFTRPFRHTSLALSLPVLLFELSTIMYNGYVAPQAALALGLSWWLATAILLLTVRPYPLQLTALSALLAFPVGLWLNQTWLFATYAWHWAWHAAGFAILTPLYITLGWWIKQKEQTDWHLELKSFGFIKNRFGRIEQLSEMILAVAWLLALVAGGLSLGRIAVMAFTHTLLAASFLLIAILWQRPRVLWAMSFLLLTASGAWQGYRGVSPSELTLPWALLAILHIIAAVRLPDRHAPYRTVLTQAAVLLAAFALLPPLLLFDASMLSYALLNWIGVTGWLAYLYHTNRWSVSTTLLAKWPSLSPPLLLQWLAAPAVMPWLLLLGRDWTIASRTLLLALATWSLLPLVLRLRQTHWPYRRPWQTATHLTALATFYLAHTGNLALPELLAMTAVALFYFTTAWLYKNRWWLPFAALLLPYTITLHFISTDINLYTLMIVLGSLTFVYMLAGYYTQTKREISPSFLNPFYWTIHLMTLPLLAISGLLGLLGLLGQEGLELPKAAVAISAITAAYTLYAWLTKRQFWAHTAVWLLIFSSGLFVIAYSQGSGLSAFLIALLATSYITAERWLSGRARRKLDPATNPHGTMIRKAWRLFRQPLHIAGWTLSALAILAALGRNLFLLEAANTQHLWSIAALFTITTLYTLSAYWFKQVQFVYFSSAVWIAAWTVGTNLIHINWVTQPSASWFTISWVICVFTLLTAALAIAEQTPFFWRGFWRKTNAPSLNAFSWAPQIMAHGLVLFTITLIVNSRWLASATLTAALAAVFYTATLLIDRRYRPVSGRSLGRFLYPAAIMLIYTTYLAVRFAFHPADLPLAASLVLIAYTFPALWLGRILERSTKAYGLPLYLTAYAVTLLALALVIPHQHIFTLYLLIAAAQTLLSTIWFQRPLWLYPMSLFLFAATITGFHWLNFATHQIGWAIALLGGGFFVTAAVLCRSQRHPYATPLLTAGFITTAISLFFTSFDRTGALIGYSIVSLIYTAVALWLQRPLLFNIALPLAAVPYTITTSDIGLPPADHALAMWPGILLLLILGRWLDDQWGWLKKERTPFPWYQPANWLTALLDRLQNWWAFPFYYGGLTATLISPLLAFLWGDSGRTALVFALGTAVFIWATYRFKLRPYLFLAATWLQLATLSTIIWLGLNQSTEQLLNTFSPLIILTAALTLLIEHTLNEAPLFVKDEAGWSLKTAGWSRALYPLLAINFFVTLMLVLIGQTSGVALLIQTLLFALFATRWRLPPLAYLTEFMLVITVIEFGRYISADLSQLPVTLAWIALAYGALSYTFSLSHHKYLRWPERVIFWTRPLKIGSWGLSFVALLTSLAITTHPQVDTPHLFIALFAILGLLYLTTALAEQKPRLGYGALLLLLLSWSMWLLLIQEQSELQLYALPAAAYLLGIGWIEWRMGHKLLAGWIDRAAFLLLIGSALWQSFGDWGGLYALLLIAEGLVLVWIGSTRRMRRHLYVGVAAVLLAIVSQILEPLFNLNAFILLLLGAALTVIGIALERRLEAVRVLSKEFRTHLEHWD